MSTSLIVSFEVDGIHFWPNAPDKYKEFGQPHRHLFKVICVFPTGDSSDPTRRDVELWELRQNVLHYVKERFGKEPINFGPMSVEGIADVIKNGMGFDKVLVCEEWFIGAIVS